MNARLLSPLLLCSLLPALNANETGSNLEFFEKKVRPILSARCFECHSSEKKIKGGLSLDTRSGWAKGGDTGVAIIPGKPDESLLINAAKWIDRDLQMPPKKKLPTEEIQILEEWVRLGAPDPRTETTGNKAHKSAAMSVADGKTFWSYSPLKPVQSPEVKDNAWPSNTIDRFVLSKLEQAGIQPAEDATTTALVRRLSYALTGLPPNPQQVAAFVKASEDNPSLARQDFVEGAMKSPQFGEKWGRHWLDVARFAESSGGGRTLLFKDAWRYRDYVIQAFNEDRPFNQFIREQIAGDLLPSPTPQLRAQQLTATGFLAIGPTIYEEQDKQRLRFDVIDEQLDTIGKGVLGQTIGCARCHDHKFDPITHRDYYALAGIFASTRTLSNYKDNVVTWIDTILPLKAEQQHKLAEEQAAVTAAEKTLQQAKNQLADIKKAQAGIPAAPVIELKKTQDALTPGQPLPLSVLAGVALDDSDAKAIGDWKQSTHSPQYFGKGYVHDNKTDKGTKTLTFTPKLPHSGRYEVRLAFQSLADRATNVPVHIFHAMGDTTVYVDQSRTPEIEGRFASLGSFTFEADGESYVIVSTEGTKGYVCVDALQFLPDGTSDQLVEKPKKPAKSDERTQAIAKLQGEIKGREKALAELKAKQGKYPVVMSVREEDGIADTQIRIRGDVNQRGATVPRGFLSVAWDGQSPVFNEHESGRIALADWLVSSQNPLTARVFVNRVWAWLFGVGLVRTTDNFGTTGEAPSHPELLDYLAQSFIEHNWSTKTLIREILSSRTWQLAATTPNADSKDPDNRLLAHALRRRLDAEQIRDSILAVSGALETQMGGPNIKGATSADPVSFEASKVEFEYTFTDKRRSVYTPAFRNNRLELFATFDFSDINSSLGQRYTSTVATQALYFLNHPFVLEQARIATQHTPRSSSTSDIDQITAAFQSSIARPPSPQEAEACLKQLSSAGGDTSARQEAWATIYQSLFGCIDFRYLN